MLLLALGALILVGGVLLGAGMLWHWLYQRAS
jgi:hypothetical protein